MKAIERVKKALGIELNVMYTPNNWCRDDDDSTTILSGKFYDTLFHALHVNWVEKFEFQMNDDRRDDGTKKKELQNAMPVDCYQLNMHVMPCILLHKTMIVQTAFFVTSHLFFPSLFFDDILFIFFHVECKDGWMDC